MVLLLHALILFKEDLPLLYRIGTMAELSNIAFQLPEAILSDLIFTTATLDQEYGAARDYLASGGYSVIVETENDLPELKQIIDCDVRHCEWVTRHGDFFSILYLRNDDYFLNVYIPADLIHIINQSELED